MLFGAEHRSTRARLRGTPESSLMCAAPPAPATLPGRHQDPIVAVATAPGRGAVGVVRASGRDLSLLIQAVCGRKLLPRQATLLPFAGGDGQALDRGLAIHFPAPHSYTGEDVLELQAHGGPVLLQLLLARCLQAQPGLRLAEPGEFTERAFLNDKIDLAQAEAVADLIDASTEAAARSAARSLSGAFSAEVALLAERTVRLRMLVEATLDFPEEEIDFLEQAGARAQMDGIESAISATLARARQGALLREGLHVVLAGQTNVGKSSLLNALAGAELAIVTPIAGTTRDKISQTIQIEGVPLHVIDTAGLRADHEAADEVERIGIGRSWQAIGEADAVVFLHDLGRIGQLDYDDADAAIGARLPQGLPVLHVFNKADLAAHAGRARRRHRLVGRTPARDWRPCARRCCSRPAGRPPPRACSLPARAMCRPCAAACSTCSRPKAHAALCATPRWICWPKTCAWRTARCAKSPVNSATKTCWARSSGASASASERPAKSLVHSPVWGCGSDAQSPQWNDCRAALRL
jgi:tRNA modification GTPase